MANRFVLALLVLAAACGLAGPVKTPTPGGLVVYYTPNEKRLSAEKARELDERHAAVLDCLPPEAIKRHEPPTFAIDGRCDTFWDPFIKRPIRGYTQLNGNHRIVLPGSLGAAAHEMTHYYVGEIDGNGGKPYREKWLARCGDVIDASFRRLYPPKLCPGDPGFKEKS